MSFPIIMRAVGLWLRYMASLYNPFSNCMLLYSPIHNRTLRALESSRGSGHAPDTLLGVPPKPEVQDGDVNNQGNPNNKNKWQLTFHECSFTRPTDAIA